MAFRKKSNLPDRVRPLEPDGSARNHSSASTVKLVPAVGAAFVGVILLFAATVADRTETTAPPLPTAAPIETPEPAPIQGTSAVGVFQDFVAHVNQGDTRPALALLANELPDVLGLGTAQYPHLAADVALWEDGRLDRRRAEQFVDEISAMDSEVFVFDCGGFGDGPHVIITRCSYSTVGGSQHPEESGRLFGVMVEGKIAGMIREAAVTGGGAPLWWRPTGVTRS